MLRITRRRLVLASTTVGAALAAEPLVRRVRAAELLLSLAKAEPTAEPSLVESDLTIPSDIGPIRARIYRKAGTRGAGIVVAHGVHYRSIDEKRLVRFARGLAANGAVVLTPELAELADYRISAQGVTVIDAAVRRLSAEKQLALAPRVGLVGFSFAGGLALVAATRPEVQSRLGYVASVGGHHDLERVLEFLLHDEVVAPSGLVHAKAHEYGFVVLLYQELERFVNPEDLSVMREAVRAWLHEDRRAAATIATRCRTSSGKRLFHLLETSQLRELTPLLEERVRARQTELRALSPRGRLADLHLPLYALHGAGDSVIPPSETAWIEREATESGTEHRTLISPLIEHVEVNAKAPLGDEWALVNFMARLL